MSRLDQKIRENRNRRARDTFLQELDAGFGGLLAGANFSTNVNCIKHAAFTTWDHEADCETTTRGQIIGWENRGFAAWRELISSLKRLPFRKHVEGWFFIDTDGPYYEISSEDFLAGADSFSAYAEANDHRNFGWVGAAIDCGVIVEFNHTTFCRNQFELCTWGI